MRRPTLLGVFLVLIIVFCAYDGYEGTHWWLTHHQSIQQLGRPRLEKQ